MGDRYASRQKRRILRRPASFASARPGHGGFPAIDGNTDRAHGFTLLELLVVIVIIGLLAAYVGPKYFSQLGKSQVTVARAQIDSLEKALDTYRLDIGHYPSTEEGLAALTAPPPSAAGKWNGPYLGKNVPLDPWGYAYQYRSPASAGDYEIVSTGKDGQPGGSGENADISSR